MNTLKALLGAAICVAVLGGMAYAYVRAGGEQPISDQDYYGDTEDGDATTTKETEA